MRSGELECVHGVGHSRGLHGCDGCCSVMVESNLLKTQSSDYTPTTEEVRLLVQGASAEEFDRWLAGVKAQAWEEGLEAKFKRLEGQDSISLTNPYREGEK